MTFRVDLPGSQWAEMRGVEDLTGADQDTYFDWFDELMAAKPQPEPRPDPSNPAVMLEAPRPRFTNADGRIMRDRLLGLVLVSWSLDAPLPWAAETRRQLPVRVCNALYAAVKPMDDALSGTEEDEGEGPKPAPGTGAGGSSDTSGAGTESPLPALPAVTSSTP